MLVDQPVEHVLEGARQDLLLEPHGLPVVVALMAPHPMGWTRSPDGEESLTIPRSWRVLANRTFAGASDIVTFDEKTLSNFVFASPQH